MKLVQENALDLSTALRSLTCNPAGILGVSAGSLAAGNVADVIIYDPDPEWTLDREKLLSRGKNTPFHNWPFKGMVC